MLEIKVNIALTEDTAEVLKNLIETLQGQTSKKTSEKKSTNAKKKEEPLESTSPAPAPAPIPTQAPVYTAQQLSIAGAELMDAGKTQELQALLAQFGVPALTSLNPQFYPAFADGLRALGARI